MVKAHHALQLLVLLRSSLGIAGELITTKATEPTGTTTPAPMDMITLPVPGPAPHSPAPVYMLTSFPVPAPGPPPPTPAPLHVLTPFPVSMPATQPPVPSVGTDEVTLFPPPGGGGGGDPHFRTWGGQRYDYHGECDLVFLDCPTFRNNTGLRIHIRTVRRGYYSYIERVSLKIGQDVLEYVTIDNWMMNGVRAPKRANQKFEKYRLRVHSKAVSVRINESLKVKIDIQHRKNGFLYLSVDDSESGSFRGSLGMMGRWGSGAMVGRDGVSVIEDPSLFAQEWQVRDTDPQLFSTVRAPQYPATCLPPRKVMGDHRLGISLMQRKAEAACSSRPSDEQQECVFDVVATRDLKAAAF